MLEMVVATQNAHKVSEISAVLLGHPLLLKPLSHYTTLSPEETGQSFIENALIKARFASHATGMPALADDSGLMVPILNGEPGIHSARYAGEMATDQDNIKKLLAALPACATGYHPAYFVCVLACIRHPADPLPLILQGLCKGEITTTPKGTHGFGYDPIFWLPNHQCTMAELSPALKNQISHRAKALDKLKNELQDWLLI